METRLVLLVRVVRVVYSDTPLYHNVEGGDSIIGFEDSRTGWYVPVGDEVA